MSKEEKEIALALLELSRRIRAFPYRRNDSKSPGHRLRSLCYRLWAESEQEIQSYYNQTFGKVPID